jgi:hypothetical protein
MRNGKTHFEQVPIEVVETILRQAAAPARMPEKSSPPDSALERQAVAGFLKQEERTPCNGQL